MREQSVPQSGHERWFPSASVETEHEAYTARQPALGTESSDIVTLPAAKSDANVGRLEPAALTAPVMVVESAFAIAPGMGAGDS